MGMAKSKDDLIIEQLQRDNEELREENERVRQANLHTMDVFENMKAAKEKAEARAAELIHNRQIDKTSMLMRVSRLSETLEAIRSGEFSLQKCQQLADRALGSPVTEAAILRLQAEAVDEVNRKLTEISEGMDGRGMDPVLVMQYAASTAGEEAKRLRQQADEAEQAGGEQ